MFNSYLYTRTIKDNDDIIDAFHLAKRFSNPKVRKSLPKYNRMLDSANDLANKHLASNIMQNLDKYVNKNMKPLHKVIKSFENNVRGNQMSDSEAIDKIAYEAGNYPRKMLLTNSLIWNMIYNFKMNLYNHKHLYLVNINTFSEQNLDYVKHLKVFRNHVMNHGFTYRVTSFVSSLGAKINTSLYYQCRQWNTVYNAKHDFPYVLLKINKKHGKAKLENLSSDVIAKLIDYLDTHAYSDSKKYFVHLAKFASGSQNMFCPNKPKVVRHGFKHPNYIRSLV